MHNRHAYDVLHAPFTNKGTAYTCEERAQHGLEGLLPPAVDTLDLQLRRVREHLKASADDLHRYILLASLQDRSRTLFYKTLLDDPEQYLPLVYTPTVGDACESFGHILRRPHGMYLPLTAKGRLSELLGNWFNQDVRFIVVTDGSRILGLGDLGANGMGIPIGKLALYTACAGVPPQETLPICLDVGTDNEKLLDDPLYLGLRQKRPDEETYFAFLDEFVQAVQSRFPRCCIQFEDFNIHHATPLLEKYRDKVCCFNDDIQGTAGVAVAGIQSACRAKGESMKDQRILFLGGGGAATGIAELIVEDLVDGEGLERESALEHVRLFDINGLMTRHRDDLADFQKVFACDADPCDDFVQAIRDFQPTGIIGVSTVGGAFTDEIIETMAQINDRPLIFPYSNPTSRSECTAQAAYDGTNGRVLFGSGTPMPKVTGYGEPFAPAQGNNVYIFPAMGMAIYATGTRHVPQAAFLRAARALAQHVPDKFLEHGILYPARSDIREVSLCVAASVAERIDELGLAVHHCDDWDARIRELAFWPDYDHEC